MESLLIWLSIFVILGGPAIGSYIGAITVRAGSLHHDAKPIRSKCRLCDTTLSLPALLPLFGYFLMKGRCRHCGGIIDAIFPISEITCLLIALISVFLTTQISPLQLGGFCAVGWLLVGLSLFDIRYGRLPDYGTFLLGIMGLIFSASLGEDVFWNSVIGAAGGGIISGGIAITYEKIRGRQGLGYGDVKLISALGTWLGWTLLPTAILVGSLTALIVITVKSLRNRNLSLNTPVIFGPFLCFAAWITWISDSNAASRKFLLTLFYFF